jgi:hypothetical protein
VAVGFDKFDEGKERERLRKLSDRELIREAARYMCSLAYFAKPPRDEFVVGLGCVRKNGNEDTRRKSDLSQPYERIHSWASKAATALRAEVVGCRRSGPVRLARFLRGLPSMK